MRVRVPTVVLLCLPALALGLLLGGCDGAAPVGPDGQSDVADASSLVRSTSDLEERMTGLQKAASLVRTSSAGSPSTDGPARRVALASVTRIAPPRDTMRVGALSHAGGTVHVGYRTPGAAFGGGVDRLDASDPTALLAPSGFRSDALDVQCVAQDGDGPLYVAGGLRPSAYDGDLRGTPASLLAIDGREAPRVSVAGLSGSVGTSVAAVPGGDGGHAVYAASGEETLYGFDASLGNEGRRDVSGATLESVAATPSALFVADRDGAVHSGQLGTDGALAEVAGVKGGRVEHLQARRGTALNGERLFVALGTGGLAVLDAGSGEVLVRRESPSYTSIALHEDAPDVPNEPAGLVYAARPDGRLDVYRVDDRGLDADRPNTGLREVGTIDLGERMGMEPPVHRVVGVGCHVYAASTKGVVAMKLGTTQGCGTGGHQLPRASEDSSTTTEREATTTAVLANDTDPDGALDASSVQIQRAPAHGTVRVNESTGAVTYTPEPGFTGTDEYSYTVTDQDGWVSNEATVTMTVKALAPPPPPGG